ncbi:SURF1 family cytochrome oxidase biogenesis protein [Pseudonocardia bannensis]|uniref:SURF1-like protein n=1 Tax=Pseudonocardia bannensis TaxID=630973 RepID=A0A848DLM6_9PSEU|nr:SURF1 family cytochrome oxidase biogenesis protein [Pseudonocardia bannensis]NMH93657.1 SURF1 family protein [Pseudonocardia bannensis]
MRFLLRPGWLVTIAVVIGFVITCYTFLAPWQFGREAQRDAQQQAIDASYAVAPVPLGELVPAGAGVTNEVEWRQVQVTGTYLPEAETLVRLRVVDGKPASEVLTPLRTDDGRVVVVDRGYIATTDGQTVPHFAAPPTGTVTLTARLRLDETDPQARPVFTAGGHRQFYAADSRPIAADTGLDLMPGYLQLAPEQPGVLGPLAVAPATGGAPFTNLSYALQWLTFGAIAIVALGYFIRLEVLQRRGRGTDSKGALRDALAGRDGGVDPDGAQPDSQETPLAERYGRR